MIAGIRDTWRRWPRRGRRRYLLPLGLCASMLVGCHTLPSLDGRTESSALPIAEAEKTPLGQAITPRAAQHPGRSGIYALADPLEAFAARMRMAQAAERTLDVQYYIWRDDFTGTLLLEALHTAADRGVRVRLLLDDNGTAGLDTVLAALDSHPNIEVRLFNPFLVRRPKALGYLTHFSRANQRMHNKSFTVDNQATVIGGRNVGDEYFGATEGVLFADLDVLSVGPVVQDVSADFDRYWASESAYPVGLIVAPVAEDQLEQLARAASRVEHTPAAASYLQALRETRLLYQLLHGKLELEWARVRMVSDDPAKGLGRAKQAGMLTHQLGEILGVPEQHVELVSPYFVPTRAGTDAFVRMAQRGVRLRILTNSLEATDVVAVHSGYAKRRKDLLEAGVILYEMRRLAPLVERDGGSGPFGSSGSSLHAKTFAVDRSRLFVGSFNFDPRSARLNTELGFVIDSPVLAQQIESMFDERIATLAYEVRLTEEGDLYWVEGQGEKRVRHEREPGTGFWKRAGVFILSILPIEWLL